MLFAFIQCPSQTASEDFHSDTSGETTTSDSGRGGSDEDTHLTCVPEIAGITSYARTANYILIALS